MKSFPDWMQILVVIFMGVLIYSNSFVASFHFDDLTAITNNQHLKSLGLLDFSELWDRYSFRTFSYWTFLVNYKINGLNVWGYHFVNLIIHLINTLIVWWISGLILTTPEMDNSKLAKFRKIIPFFVAVLFVSHPLATSSITYIVQRLAALAAMFYLLSLAFYMAGRLSRKGLTVKTIWFSGSLIFACFAFFSKENAFTLPIAVVLVEAYFFRHGLLAFNPLKNKTQLAFLILVFLSLVVILLKAPVLFNSIPPVDDLTETITPYNYLLTQFGVVVKYIQLLILPVNQNLDHDIPLVHSFLSLWPLANLSVLIALLTLAVLKFNQLRLMSFGIFWFFLTLSVESSILPIKDVIFEHRTYLPSPGFFLAVTCALFYFLGESKRIILWSTLIIIVLTYSFLTYERNKIWKDDITLYSDCVLKSPGKARPLTNRGWAKARLQDYKGAIQDYSQAIKLRPEFSLTYYNRGFSYLQLNQYENALQDFETAVNIDSLYTDAYYNAGIACVHLKKYEEAIRFFKSVVRLSSNYVNAYFELGLAYNYLENYDLAVANYTQTIKLDPEYQHAWYNRGIIYGNQNKYNEALKDFSKVITLNPDFPDVFYNRGYIYFQMQKYQLALEDYSRAISIKPDDPRAHFNKALTYIKMKDWDNAIIGFNKVLAINPEYPKAKNNIEFINQQRKKK